MKNVLLSLILICGALFLSSCTEEVPETPGTASITSAPENNAADIPDTEETVTSEVTPVISDTVQELLDGIIVEAQKTAEMPMMMSAEVTRDNSEDEIGVTAEKFDELITGIADQKAAISTFAHEIALIEAKDETAASEIKELIKNSYNPQKWICVTPKKCTVIEAGKYVFLAVSDTASADALIAAFTVKVDGAGTPDEFYIFDENADIADNGLGGLILG